MARRSTASDKFFGSLLAMGIIIGLPVYVVTRIVDVTGWVLPISVIGALIVLSLFIKQRKKQARIRYLKQKYNDDDVVKMICQGYMWEGQTTEQLIDSLGRPAAVDHKYMKTRTREIWKYHPRGVNRFGLRITVDDGHVSGWGKKS